MTRIKICGITNTEDLEAAVAYGADALGFIGVKNSPRYISEQGFYEITLDPPLFVPCVVVVDRVADADEYVPDYVQFYSDAPDQGGGQGYIRAFRIRDEASLQELANYAYPAGAVLLDTYHENKLGGSGETFNWDLAVEAKRLTTRPLILAGGLTPDNVQDALQAVHPYAVDVSSGVESSPGVKDHAKVKAFIRAVREWDLRQ
ncbi:MAG: phosphoribosylanthranilate isomerase [Armatimonadota bacterium]|nr:phosphoribosylanthranilate isomerase [Armatimonadota bacterium]